MWREEKPAAIVLHARNVQCTEIDPLSAFAGSYLILRHGALQRWVRTDAEALCSDFVDQVMWKPVQTVVYRSLASKWADGVVDSLPTWLMIGVVANGAYHAGVSRLLTTFPLDDRLCHFMRICLFRPSKSCKQQAACDRKHQAGPSRRQSSDGEHGLNFPLGVQLDLLIRTLIGRDQTFWTDTPRSVTICVPISIDVRWSEDD